MLKVLQTFFIALNTVLGTCSSYFKPLWITSPNVSAVLQHDMRTVLSSWAELRICCLMFLLLRVFTAQHRKQRSETFPGWFPRQVHLKPNLIPHSSLSGLAIPSLPHSFSHVSQTSTWTRSASTLTRAADLWDIAFQTQSSQAQTYIYYLKSNSFCLNTVKCLLLLNYEVLKQWPGVLRLLKSHSNL